MGFENCWRRCWREVLEIRKVRNSTLSMRAVKVQLTPWIALLTALVRNS